MMHVIPLDIIVRCTDIALYFFLHMNLYQLVGSFPHTHLALRACQLCTDNWSKEVIFAIPHSCSVVASSDRSCNRQFA